MLGLGDIYARRQDEDESRLHASLFACADCGEVRRGDDDWYQHAGRYVCESCAYVAEHPECACNECGATDDVFAETGLCWPCEMLPTH